MQISRRHLLGGAAFGVIAASVGLPAQGARAAVPSVTAQNLLNSVGVCVHPTYTSTLYGNTTVLVQALTDLGIKHYRTESYSSAPPSYFQTFITNARNAGVKAQLISDKSWGTNASGFLSQLATCWTPAGVSGVEGQNEPDNFSTITSARAEQAALYPAFRADSRFAGIPFIGCSMAQYKNYAAYGNDGKLDAINLHAYPDSFHTMEEGPRLDSWISAARSVFGSTLPIFNTEHGYTNGVGYNTNWWVDDVTAGDYLARYVPYALGIKGITRSFSYELFDEAGKGLREGNFGLVKTDGTRKASFLTLQRLLGRLKETTTTTTPPTFTWTLSQPSTDMKVVPIIRKSGAIDLAVWRAASLWDYTTMERVTVPTVNAALNLSQAKLVHLYRPDSGTLTSISESTTAATIPVDGKLTLVRLG